MRTTTLPCFSLDIVAATASLLCSKSNEAMRGGFSAPVAHHFFQGDALVLEQGMARWHRHHQWIAPSCFGGDAFAHLIGLSKTHVVQVVMQPLDLLRQRHLEQPDIDPWGSSCLHIASNAGRRDGVMPSDSAMRNWPWKPLLAAFTLSRACSKAVNTRGTCSRNSLPARVSRVLRLVRMNN